MRLVTRSDFDGLACAVLLKEAGVIDDFLFVHPKDVQDGKVAVNENDVLANVPYARGCGLWFDHHASEAERLGDESDFGDEFQFKGVSRPADSAARIIYEYYGGKAKFGHLDPMIEAVDRSDSGKLTADEILNPKGWILLSFVMDPRTGLGRYNDYRISNYQLMMKLVDDCQTKNADQIIADPDVTERVKRYRDQERQFRDMLAKHTRIDGNVIITDLRGVGEIFTGNRFLIYALNPKQNISVWMIDGRAKQNAVFSVGHSIVNRTSKTNVATLMFKYGGGGHPKVGTCQVPYEKADATLAEIVEQLKSDG